MIGTINTTPRPRSAIVLSVGVMILLIAEACWLLNWHRANEELDRISEHRFVRAAKPGQVDGEYPMMRGERLEIVKELHRRRAAETVDEHQRRATASAEVVQIDAVDLHRA